MSPYKNAELEDPHARAAHARAARAQDQFAEDPVARDTAKLQKHIERSLEEIKELTKGIPSPSDPGWLASQREAGLAPAGDTHDEFLDDTRSKPPALLKRGASRTANGTRTKRTAKLEALDATIGQEDWYSVIEAFQFSGVPSVIAESTRLKLEAVQHILDHGIWRLDLPPVRTFCTNLSEVNKRLAKYKLPTVADLEASKDATENEPSVQQAITERVTREAAASAMALEMAALSGNLVTKLVKDICDKIESGEIFLAIPPAIGLEGLTSLVELVTAQARATSVAVKTSRLTAGEPTEILGAQISRLLEGRSIAELEELDRTGRLPPPARSRLVLEAHAESIPGSGGGAADPIATALAAEKPKEVKSNG